MKAKDISGQAPGGKRTRLAEVLPLDTPYVVQVFPVYACNFKCSYCIFSVEKQERHFISDQISMSLDLYKRCIDDLSMFPQKVKVLRFVGIGEPLIHKDIVEMVRYASLKEVAGTIEVLTNASLLTRRMSDDLVAAGLSRLVVSLQGTSEEKYKEICGAKVDFKEFLGNLKYFYEHKNKATVYIKIVDTALSGENDQQDFYSLFGDICDTIGIEYTVPIHSGINYDGVLKDKERTVTQFGLPVSEVPVCPQPFFTMQINPDGKVVPCYSFEYPAIMGDCNTQSLREIWTGEQYRRLRRSALEGDKCDVCKRCNIIQFRLFPEDDLRNDVERLKKLF